MKVSFFDTPEDLDAVLSSSLVHELWEDGPHLPYWEPVALRARLAADHARVTVVLAEDAGCAAITVLRRGDGIVSTLIPREPVLTNAPAGGPAVVRRLIGTARKHHGDQALYFREVHQHPGRPLISFLGSGEETFLVPGGRAKAGDWERVTDRISDLAAGWAGGAIRSRRFRTHEPHVWRAVQSQADADRAALPDSALDGLHRLADDLPYPRGTRFTYLYAYYRSNIAHYRKRTLEALLDDDIGHVLVVENVQQIKCVKHCAALNRTDGLRMSHLVTCPVPDVSGTVRVSRAERQHRVMLSDFLEGDVPDDQGMWSFLGRLREAFRDA